MITRSVSLSFQNDITRNNVPFFLLNVNVQLPVDESFLESMARRSQSPNKPACALQTGEPRSTRQPQRIVANVLGGP